MNFQTRFLLSLVPPLLVACSAAEPGGGSGKDERSALGKADAIGSCFIDEDDDFCGDKSDGNCWCDDQCSVFGDCCADAEAVCGEGPAPSECGGFLGLECSDGLVCIDDPDDDCDPQNGGADCNGICVDPPTEPECGGFLGLECDDGLLCIDDPDDDCDPQNGGADCNGICVDPPTEPECGGFLGLECDDGLVCVDDPDDDCDPQSGGADCDGICVEPPASASCQGSCGQNAGSCWCDAACEDYGDCCDDKQAVCG